MAAGTNRMIRNLKRSHLELKQTRDATIYSLATLAETRDNETGHHILRTQRYVKTLALQLRNNGKHLRQLNDDYIELLYKSAPLHDIGKVGIPDHILLKPEKLTREEFEIMKQHARIGAEALEVAAGELGSNSFLQVAQEIAGGHHEKWDGSGYPRALAGTDIPLSARLMALADVYDALISKRVYKQAFSHARSRAIIVEGAGRHFDPDVVEAFLNSEQIFIRIAQEYQE